jgi:primosomal protein N' (replication factor Y)
LPITAGKNKRPIAVPPAALPESAALTLTVLVALPAHSRLPALLTYLHTESLPAGTLLRVPLGSREVLGVVWDESPKEPSTDSAKLKSITSVLHGLPPLPATWRRLVAFSARYYQRSLGEVALAALPPQLRDWSPEQLARKLKKLEKNGQKQGQKQAEEADKKVSCSGSFDGLNTEKDTQKVSEKALNAAQAGACSAIAAAQGQAGSKPILLFGRTGSGKTEVYMQAAAATLAASATAQVLVLVPEINLTPQLLAQFGQRFAHLGADAVVSMHSAMTPAERSTAWLAAHSGHARIVLGTRLAVFASLPDLRLIAVDEEHDASYKAQDGARHSARDLAVYRAKLESERLQEAEQNTACAIVLGSATPSLESWLAAQTGRYQLCELPERIGNGRLAPVRLVDMRLQPKGTVISTYLLAAIGERIARGEQSLLLLNRRGYAPVLSCGACGWKSACGHCSAFKVFHKIDRSLRCHHCGDAQRVPRACPECGNLDIAPVGRGTEKLEEEIETLLADIPRPDGGKARVLRMDADSVKGKDGLTQHLAQMHSGEIDVLVGTQMVAKGHDFRRITLVAAINPDGGLFAADFRAPERSAALLMQAAGRAGRDADLSGQAQMLVQTFAPEHPLFTWLMRHDWAGFANSQLQEREMAVMPPYSHQALLRAEARTQEGAQAFLQAACDAAEPLLAGSSITLYAPVPMPMQRVANVERAQLLIEADDRRQLQQFLSRWRMGFGQLRSTGLLRWALDVDPAAV